MNRCIGGVAGSNALMDGIERKAIRGEGLGP
jgi:hypothetical protein